MYKIVVANKCDCLKDTKIKAHQKFDTKDEAINKALELVKFMNMNCSCKKEYEVQEIFNNFMIKFYEEEKEPCCGNGCGSSCTAL